MTAAAQAFALAARHLAAGNFAAAEQFSLSALKEDPNHAAALHLLGVIARHKGNSAEALDYLQKSLDRNGSNAVAWKDLGDAHLVAKNFSAAVTNYEQATRLQPDLVEAYNHMGIALQHRGDWPRAAHCFRQAIRLVPSYVPAHNNLGSALKGLGKLAEAIAAFKQALVLQPDNAEIAHNLGTAFHEDGELDQAATYYRQALRLEPGSAVFSTSLASALKEQGLLEEAVAQLRHTVTLQPDYALAYYNLSELAAEGRYQFTPDELERLKACLASERFSASDRSLFCFTQAAVLDRQGSYDEAFGFYQKANDLRQRVLDERNAGFDIGRHDAFVDRIIASYDGPYFARVKEWGTATDLPIFVVGMPRSGSTLVEQILASHPQVFGAGETGDMNGFINLFSTGTPVAHYDTPLLHDPRAARELAANFLKWLGARGHDAARVTVKALTNFLHIGMIATLFPGARIIHCRRHPLDVCLSCYFQNFQKIDFACSLEGIGAYYRAYERLMAHWSRVLPFPIHDVRYEDLVHGQEAVTRKLLDYCGLDWDERCLAFWKTRRAVQTASTVQVRKPISGQAVGRWRHYRPHLGPLFQALGPSIATEEFVKASQ